MSKILKDLLAVDEVARQYGVGLNPRLREMITADLRFPSHAASPAPRVMPDAENMPENVLSLRATSAEDKKASA